MPNQHPLDSFVDFIGMTDEEREAHYESLRPEVAARKRRVYEGLRELASIDEELGGAVTESMRRSWRAHLDEEGVQWASQTKVRALCCVGEGMGFAAPRKERNDG